MVTNIDNRQDAAKAGLRGKLPRVRGSGPLEWGQAKAKDAKKRILRPDYTNKMFVDTTEPHKLLGDTVKKSYEMSDTSIIAAVVAECERMRSAASAHRTADSSYTSSLQLKFCGVEIIDFSLLPFQPPPTPPDADARDSVTPHPAWASSPSVSSSCLSFPSYD